jgi:hypothetical protein
MYVNQGSRDGRAAGGKDWNQKINIGILLGPRGAGVHNNDNDHVVHSQIIKTTIKLAATVVTEQSPVYG